MFQIPLRLSSIEGVCKNVYLWLKYEFMGELIKVDFQYQVMWVSTFNFSVGELVFLKSNPELPLMVEAFGFGNKVIVSWLVDGDKSYHGFSPELILQYKYRPLLIWKDKYKVCLN